MYNAAMPSHRQPIGEQYPPARQDGAYPRRPANNQAYPAQPRQQPAYTPQQQQQQQQPYGQYQQYPPQQPRQAYAPPQQYGRAPRPYQQYPPVTPQTAPVAPRQYQQPYAQPVQTIQPVQPVQPLQPVQHVQPILPSQPQRYGSTGSAELDPDRIHQLEAKIQQLELQLRKTSSNSPAESPQQKSDQELASSFPSSSQNYTAHYTGDESAEQENTGGLQYSRSIYRSNFDKAGFKSIRRKEPTTADPINEAMRNSASSSDTLNDETKPLSPRVRRRRLPEQQIIEEDEDDFDFRGSTSSSHHAAPQTVPLPDVPSDFKSMPVRSPAPRQQTIPKPVVSNLSNRSEESLKHSPARSTSGIKGSEYGGVVPPLVQKKSFDRLVLDFKNARQAAIQDYRTFTPRIQMEWAKILLEVISSKDIMTKMAIDGSMRKRPVQERDLQAVKEQFCNTAVKVLKKIVNIDRGETRAKLYLGDLLSGGIHPGLVERDEAEGYSLFYEAALNDKDSVAMYRVGCCLEIGVGTPQSVPRALEFFNKAAEHGDPSAMCQLGILEFTGQYGRRRNIEKSIYWHVQAARSLANTSNDDILITARSFSDARGALYTLAKIYHTDLDVLCLTGNSPGVMDTIDELKRANAFRNQIKTMEYYLEAARLGHKDAQATLGYVFATGYLPTHTFRSDKAASNGHPIESVDARKSIYWYSKAAEKGHPLAAMGLGIWYTDGVPGVLQSDSEQGFLWVRKGAEAGCANAEFVLGTYYENGLGTVKSMEQALRWYKRAASQGYSKAIKRLQKNQMI